MSFASSNSAITHLQPETQLGGYSALDGTIEFYSRVKLLLEPQMTAVDLGAGRGAWFEEDASAMRKATRLLKGHVAQVIGCDVDEAVMQNRAVDSARLLEPGKPWPLDNNSVDVMVCDYVLEHITSPTAFASEVLRTLKPGGWFCARTPSRYNYVSIGARLVSNRRHGRVLAAAQPGRKEIDVFPTVYRMNTASDIRSVFPPALFGGFTYTYSSEPHYYFGRAFGYRVFQLLHRLLPAAMTGNLFIFLQKRG